MVSGIPIELVFAPDWWHQHYGTVFDEDFFFDPERRAEDERAMRRALAERFPRLYGALTDEDRPTAGPVWLACGFVLSQICGCKVTFREGGPPEVVPLNLSDEEFAHYELPDLRTNTVMGRLRALMDTLEERFGYVEGDFNVGGVLNLALDIRGQSLFVDAVDHPEATRRFLDRVADTLIAFFQEVRDRTGTTSISINRSILNVDPVITIHGNCSVQMVSRSFYDQFVFPYDVRLAELFQPYGVHHCGNNMHQVAESYAKIPGAAFFDVGWGSDVAACRSALPDAFLNLRLSPVKMAKCAPGDVRADAERLVRQAAPYDRAGLCCVNMDGTVSDENVQALIDSALDYDGRC